MFVIATKIGMQHERDDSGSWIMAVDLTSATIASDQLCEFFDRHESSRRQYIRADLASYLPSALRTRSQPKWKIRLNRPRECFDRGLPSPHTRKYDLISRP